MKICTTCKKECDISFFNKDKQKKDGLNPRCRTCSKAWNANNKQRVAAYNKKHYAENAERNLSRAAKYRKENRDTLIIKKKVWDAENKVKVSQYRAARKDDYTAHARNRRARIKGNGGTHTGADVKLILIKQNHSCAICKIKVDAYHVDHVYPISKGGSNDPSNLQILCAPCNLSKNDTDPIEYAQLRGYLL